MATVISKNREWILQQKRLLRNKEISFKESVQQCDRNQKKMSRLKVQ